MHRSAVNGQPHQTIRQVHWIFSLPPLLRESKFNKTAELKNRSYIGEGELISILRWFAVDCRMVAAIAGPLNLHSLKPKILQCLNARNWKEGFKSSQGNSQSAGKDPMMQIDVRVMMSKPVVQAVVPGKAARAPRLSAGAFMMELELGQRPIIVRPYHNWIFCISKSSNLATPLTTDF
jgi:hypothetical protein